LRSGDYFNAPGGLVVTFSTIRKFIGALVSGFGFASLFFADWFFAKTPEMSVTPDPSRALLYPCYPKSVPWYYSAYTVVKSWDFVVFILICTLGAIIMWEVPNTGSHKNPKWPYNKTNTFAFIVGGLLALGFFSQGGEKQVVEWVMEIGVRPPAVICFPMFAGVS